MSACLVRPSACPSMHDRTGQIGQSEGLTQVCLHMLEGEHPAPAAEEGSPPRTELTATTPSPLQQPRGDAASSLTEGPEAGAGWSLRGPPVRSLLQEAHAQPDTCCLLTLQAHLEPLLSICKPTQPQPTWHCMCCRWRASPLWHSICCRQIADNGSAPCPPVAGTSPPAASLPNNSLLKVNAESQPIPSVHPVLSAGSIPGCRRPLPARPAPAGNRPGGAGGPDTAAGGHLAALPQLGCPGESWGHP